MLQKGKNCTGITVYQTSDVSLKKKKKDILKEISSFSLISFQASVCCLTFKRPEVALSFCKSLLPCMQIWSVSRNNSN